jgi:hypothetical protein
VKTVAVSLFRTLLKLSYHSIQLFREHHAPAQQRHHHWHPHQIEISKICQTKVENRAKGRNQALRFLGEPIHSRVSAIIEADITSVYESIQMVVKAISQNS